MNKKTALFLSLLTTIGIVMIALWISIVDIALIRKMVEDMDKGVILAAVFVYILAYFVRSFRWNLLLKPVICLGAFRTWVYSVGGNFVNYLIPIRLGEVAKAWMIKKNHGISIHKSLPTVFIDKTFDTVSILILILILPFISVKLNPAVMILMGILMLVFILSFLLLIGAALHRESCTKLLSKMLGFLPVRLKIKLENFVHLFLEGLDIFRHHWSILLWAMLLTIIGILLDGFYFFLMFKAFGYNMAFLTVFFGYTLINLSYALPQPPAQLGSNEWMMIVIFSLGFGLTAHGASAIMAVAHVLTALVICVLGFVSFSISGSNMIRKILRGEDLYEQ